MLGLIQEADIVLAHNAQYELGILHYIYKDSPAAIKVIRNKTIVDTKILYKLHNNTLRNYSLDGLAKKYLREDKQYDLLADAVWNNNLYPWFKYEEAARDKAQASGEDYTRERPDDKKLLKFAYENMDLVQEVDYITMADYAVSDASITYRLYENVIQDILPEHIEKYSNLLHACVEMRLRGVRVDLTRAREIYDKITPMIVSKYNEAVAIAGEEFNPNSPKELPLVFDKLGIEYKKTDKGNPSITTPWLESQFHPLCKLVVDIRKYKKIQGDFIKKIIDMQEITCPGATTIGKIYPEINILAAKTGRFSSSNINIQQIPSRDKQMAPLCRSIFLPEEGERMYSLDYSNQEGRLQVHYAYRLNCEGAALLRQEFINNPELDLHQKVAELTGLSRSEAKIINLAISYGMGVTTLAKSLGLTNRQATLLRDKYNSTSPFLVELNDICMKKMGESGNIKTIGSRRVSVDKPVIKDGEMVTFSYKALNLLIQGSATDQIIDAIVEGHKQGIKMLFPVHDQLVISSSRKEDAVKMKNIMETCTKLEIPSVVDCDLNGGNCWSDAGH